MEHRKILDDLFNAYTMIGRGSYVSLYDVKGNLTRYSPAAVELFGLPGEYIPAGDFEWIKYVHPEDRFHYSRVMKALIKGELHGYDLTYRTQLKDGSYATLRYVGTVIGDADGNPELIGGVIINEGLTESTDPVTVLRNQYGFFRDLAAAVELKRTCVAMLCGINRMNQINEEHGYAFGNSVLQQTGWLLQEIAWTARSSLSLPRACRPKKLPSSTKKFDAPRRQACPSKTSVKCCRLTAA